MRALLLLLPVLYLVNSQATGGYAAESVPEQLSDVKLNDYLGAIKSIEDTALAQVHQVYSEAEAAKDELYGSWASRVKQVWKDKMMKDAEKALQLELIKQEMVDRYKAETEKVYMQAVQAAKEYQQAYLDAKAAQRQAIADKYNEFKQIVNASIESKVAQAKENMAEIGAYLQQVDELYRNHKAASDAAIEERRQALKDKLATIYNQLETQGNELKADGERLGADLKAFMEKRYQYKQDGHGAAKEVLKEVLTESLEQKLEKKLDKELQKMVEDEIKGKLKHPKMALPVVVKKTTDTETETKVVSPEYKATLLETLTGASAWETVAWVLLALCILLSVALIALIAYQVAQKNKYGKLEGVDSPHRPSMARAERAPFNTAPPLTYTHEKPLFGSGLPGPSEAQRKAQEREQKKAEVRKRLEESGKAGKKKKQGFLTPERKKKLRKLLMTKAAEDLKQQQLKKEQERQKFLAERTVSLPNIDGTDDHATLEKYYNELFSRLTKLEEEKYDILQIVQSAEAEINELTINVNDLRGKFVKPTLKKVSKYDNRFKKLAEIKKTEGQADFRKELKTVKKENVFTQLANKKKADQKPDWKAQKAAKKAADEKKEEQPKEEEVPAEEPAAEEPEEEEEEEDEEEEEE
ncbi:unnamed protein product, partial [Mesorhabditis spiculigera]